MNSYYVYGLYRDEDMKVPFYIGKGKGERWLAHEKQAANSNVNLHRLNIIRKFQRQKLAVPKRIIRMGLTEVQAHSFEIKLIAKYGRIESGGLLVNLTDGGDGVSGLTCSEKTRNKIRKTLLSFRDEISAKAKEAHSRPETKARHSASIKAANARPEVKAKRKATMSTLEYKLRQSRALKLAAARPEVKSKRLVANRKLLTIPGLVERRSESIRRTHAKQKFKRKMREINANPSVKANRSAATKKVWSDPILKKKYSRAAEDRWSDPVKRKKLLEARAEAKRKKQEAGMIYGSELRYLPTKCPACDTKLKWTPTKVDIYCPNDKCPGTHGQKVVAFFKHLGVDDVAEKTVLHLMQNGLDTIPKIIHGATPQRLVKLEGYQARKAKLVADAIKGALKEVPLAKVMHASGCFSDASTSLGSTRLQAIISRVGEGKIARESATALRTKLVGMPGAGKRIIDLFLDGLEEWRAFFNEIGSVYTPPSGVQSLRGLVICFTGFRSDEMQSYIEKAGGRVAGMSKLVNVLFASTPSSAKCHKADEYGIPIVPQDKAWEWLKARAGGK